MISTKINKDGSYNIDFDGTTLELVKDWMHITSELCDELTKETGANIGIEELISTAQQLLNKEQQMENE